MIFLKQIPHQRKIKWKKYLVLILNLEKVKRNNVLKICLNNAFIYHMYDF